MLKPRGSVKFCIVFFFRLSSSYGHYYFCFSKEKNVQAPVIYEFLFLSLVSLISGRNTCIMNTIIEVLDYIIYFGFDNSGVRFTFLEKRGKKKKKNC